MTRRILAWFVASAPLLGCGDGETVKTEPVAPMRPAAEVAKPARADPLPEPGPPVRKDGTIYGESELMGTRVSVNVYVGEEAQAADAGRAMQAALDEMARIESLMSEWKPQSELSNLNRAAGGPAMEISPELFEVLQRGREISEASDGAFDVTFHAVGQLWSFRPGARPPSKEAVAAKLPLVDYAKVELTPAKVGTAATARLRDAGMMVGLGAIAKGYAVDRASKVLTEAGFANHVVEAGGDTYAAGSKDGKAWMVGVQNPDGRGALGSIPASDVAIVTSGNYQRYFEHEGKQYAHILDPKSGWPIPSEDSPKSVTLVSGTATDADAFCTAVAVMGPTRGMEFVESRADIDAIVVTTQGEVLVSTGLRDAYRSFESPE